MSDTSILQGRALACLALVVASASWSAPQTPERTALPAVLAGFSGTLNATEQGSTPYVPVGLAAPQGAPNVLLVMTDDVGFSAASSFGGPVPTPHLDQLAERGLRYNRFHTTAICSPTRAALLTGRNHHAVGTGFLADVPSPYPGYTTRIPRSAATIARILRDNGYNTAMFGKDHNVPTVDRSPAGPFEHWPTGRGFETFYGFVAGDTNQWRPALFEGTTPVDLSHREAGRLLDEDLIDRAINWLHNQQASSPGKPFFMYYAPGTAHAPLQAPEEWIARFRGKFDDGWDALRERILARQIREGIVPPGTRLAQRPPEIPAWGGLSKAERAVYARHMEVFAAMLAYQDAQFGRLMAELERMGLADNTLVIYIQGDNGGSGEGAHHGTLNLLAHLSGGTGEMPVDVEWLADNLDILGGPDTYLGFAVGWALATSTPFPWVKQIASHLGGVRNGLVISWPERIASQGEIRSQYHHVIDVLPTILEAAGIPAPESVDGVPQQPIDGISMLQSFASGDSALGRSTQYYEVLGNRGIYHEGWLANTRPRNMPWQIAQVRAGSDVSSYDWELYNLEEDFSQSRDLAAEHPEKLAELQAVFDREARRHQVYPVHDTGAMGRVQKLMSVPGAPNMFVPAKTLWGRDIHLSLAATPPIFSLPFFIEADIEVPEGGAEGVVVAAGSRFGGWSFYLDEGVPVAVAAVSPLAGGSTRVAAGQALSPGRRILRYELGATGEMKILVDGQVAGSGRIEQRPHVMAGGGETFDTGRDKNDPVSLDYANEGVFSGTLHRVDVAVQMPAHPQVPVRPD
jgi:arylsulfatase